MRLILALVFLPPLFAWWLGIRINWTPSVPTGLYIRDASGPFVEFCPVEPYAALSKSRDYRPSFGTCPDGRQPLLKRLVAKPGDRVTLSADGMRVNGYLIPSSAPRASDSRGRPLPAYLFGSYTVGSGASWVTGDHPQSFDSRYFGPVPASAIRARLRRLF